MKRIIKKLQEICVQGETLTLSTQELDKNIIGEVKEFIYKANYLEITNNSGKLVAACVYGIADKFCWIDNINILDPSYGNKALGTQLIKFVEKEAKENGCKFITGLYIPYGDLQANTEKFYQKNNYQIVKCKRKCLGVNKIYKNLDLEK